MAEKRYLKVEDMFEMVSWNPCEEKFLVDLLIDYASNGKLFGAGMHDDALKEIVSELTKVFGKTFCYLKVDKKFKSLKKRYKLWDTVTFWQGVRFNLAENKCEAVESTWAAIVKDHPYAKKYRIEGEKLWCELSLIFGGQGTETAELKARVDSLLNYHRTADVVEIYDIDDDGGDGVSDQLSRIGMDVFNCAPSATRELNARPSTKDKTVAGDSSGKLKMIEYVGQ